MSSWHAPQSIYSLGHKAAQALHEVPCYLTEKIDGSFFAFGLIDGELKIRSKGAVMEVDYPEKMFAFAATTVKRLYGLGLLHEGWTYRGEYLQKPKHNSLAYERIPKGHIILFDVCTAEEAYLDYDALLAEAERMGLECVRHLGYATPNRPLTPERITQLLETRSVLGGQKIEGFVVKPCTPIYGHDKKLLMAKYVSEAFKEVHSKAWGESNPSSGDVIDKVVKKYATAARWNKAIQHLKEAGQLEMEPRDIPKLLKEVVEDVHKEEYENIKDDLMKWAWDHIRRGLTRGLPEFYKEHLMREALINDPAGAGVSTGDELPL